MGKPITFEQDPIAMFLEYQLPQMVQQANEAEKNRVHELNVLEKQQELGQKNFLLETQVNQGIKQLDGLMADIDKKEEAIAKTGLIADQFKILPAKDQSEGIGELTELVKTDQDNSWDGSVNAAENLTDYIGNQNNELMEGKQYEQVLDRLQAGIEEGKRRSQLITGDLTGDAIITAEDFSEYLELTGNPFEEGSPQYHGFISEAPGLKEGLDLAQQFKDLDYRDAQIANLDSETQQSLNEMIGGRYGTGAILNNETFNERMRLISDGYQALETNLAGTDFMENTPFKMSSFDYTKDKNWYKDPYQMESMVGDLGANIISQLTHSETGITNPTDDKLDGLMEQYNNTNDAALKKTAMDKIVARLGEIDLSGELDYNSQSAQGIEYMKKQLFHYGELRDAQNLLNQPEQVLQQLQSDGTEADPSGLGIGSGGPTVEEEVDDVIPTPTVEDLNIELGNMAGDIESISSPRLKESAANTLKEIEGEQSRLGQGDALSALSSEASSIKDELNMLVNSGLIDRSSKKVSPRVLMGDEVPTVDEGIMTGSELQANNRYLELRDRLWEITENELPFQTGFRVGGHSMGQMFDRDFNQLDKYIAKLNRKGTSDLEELIADLGGILEEEDKYKTYAQTLGIGDSGLITGK